MALNFRIARTILIILSLTVWGAICAKGQVSHINDEKNTKIYKVIDGQLREVVTQLADDSTTVEVVVLDSLNQDATVSISKRMRRREERARQEADSSFRRHSFIFRDTIPVSRVLWTSAILPGYSQLYNKQYWKIPILYATVGTSLYFGMKQKDKYKTYKRQYDALRLSNADYDSEMEAIHRKMIKHNTYKQMLFGTAIASYLYFIGDGAMNYAGKVDPVKKATTLSTICPGAGQIYNRSYWKVPIVVGGFAALGYVIDFNNRGYKRFKLAYTQVTDGDDSTVDEFNGRYSASYLKSLRNSYRRNRDFAIILTGAFYLLNIVDAHVDAHLKDYDVSDNLAMWLEPSVNSFYSQRSGNAYTYGVTLKMAF